ncbi:site-specific DNA-methyltransferase [Acidisoma cellulosilytica]|uniref:Methyltransferase n=1 Tax=Acidisoma cellulosilyticum TaxID=2802395 RepID=A0A964E2X3_9PROT|nr:site-specific DNA-methyltransferase [Acidisoma cellulosilyticum]MCB8880095.1 site-specific DNA-methyltransferase [Acidisoma cellulosilyticum]
MALPSASVHCCVTSPPYYGLRDYGMDGQIGLEVTPEAYVAEMVAVFREVRRVLRDDGTLWLNIGDSYAGTPGGYQGKSGQRASRTFTARIDKAKGGEGLKPKDLIGIPWMLAFALRADGWYLRSDIIWHKPNPMPESVSDRPTNAHEHVFLLSKSAQYFYDADAIKEVGAVPAGTRAAKGSNVRSELKDVNSRPPEYWEYNGFRNARSVWTIATQPYGGAHFATMAPDLAERCIKAGSKPADVVLDPFGGAGTTGMVADRLGRSAILIELNPAYAAIATDRIHDDAGMFAQVSA